MSDTLAVLAASWGVLMAISPILQVRRILERQSSDDVSLGYLGVLLVGFTLWVAYGISLQNAALIIPNFVALVVGVVTVIVARRYRTPTTPTPGSAGHG
jgi:MtN3 and saliva related transmembrane protein